MITKKIGFGSIKIKGGKPGNLDAIKTETLYHNNIAIVMDDNKIWFYYLDKFSGEVENPPYIVKPIDITAITSLSNRFKRWKLAYQDRFTTNIVMKESHYLQTSIIQSIEDNNLSIILDDYTIIIDYDGKVMFPNTVSGVYPSIDNNITIKKYIIDITNELDDYIKNNFEETIDNKLIIPVNNYMNNKLNELQVHIENYLSNEITEKQNELDDNIDYTQIVNIDFFEELSIPLIDNINNIITVYYDRVDNMETDHNEDLDNMAINFIDYYETSTSESLSAFTSDIEENYKYQLIISNTWSLSGDNYYTDIVHSLNTDKFIDQYYIDNGEIIPEKIEYIDNNNIRIWMPINTETIETQLFYIEE